MTTDKNAGNCSGLTEEATMTTRKEQTQEIINRGDVAELLRLAEGYPCACMGAKDDEPECFCRMNSKQVRNAVSLAALRRGELVRLRNNG